jgi:hypothetical protein
MRSRGISCLRLAKRSRDLSDVACTPASASRNSWIAASIRSRFFLNSSPFVSIWLSKTGIAQPPSTLGVLARWKPLNGCDLSVAGRSTDRLASGTPPSMRSSVPVM